MKRPVTPARPFFRKLLIGNAIIIAILTVLAFFFVRPNCPGEFCDWQIFWFGIGSATILASGNFTAISLYFAIRFWRQ